MVELGFDPKVKIKWLKFGTWVPYGVHIHEKKTHLLENYFALFGAFLYPPQAKV